MNNPSFRFWILILVILIVNQMAVHSQIILERVDKPGKTITIDSMTVGILLLPDTVNKCEYYFSGDQVFYDNGWIEWNSISITSLPAKGNFITESGFYHERNDQGFRTHLFQPVENIHYLSVNFNEDKKTLGDVILFCGVLTGGGMAVGAVSGSFNFPELVFSKQEFLYSGSIGMGLMIGSAAIGWLYGIEKEFHINCPPDCKAKRRWNVVTNSQ